MVMVMRSERAGSFESVDEVVNALASLPLFAMRINTSEYVVNRIFESLIHQTIRTGLEQKLDRAHWEILFLLRDYHEDILIQSLGHVCETLPQLRILCRLDAFCYRQLSREFFDY